LCVCWGRGGVVSSCGFTYTTVALGRRERSAGTDQAVTNVRRCQASHLDVVSAAGGSITVANIDATVSASSFSGPLLRGKIAAGTTPATAMLMNLKNQGASMFTVC
jgi:hypothetical protein